MNAVRIVLIVLVGLCLVSAGFAVLGRAHGDAPLPTLQVEVMNGCGVDGLARRAARGLQELRQDVVGVDTVRDHAFATSFLIDRRGKPRLTRRLAERIGPCRVVLERTDDARADVTLVLGSDWRSLALFGGSAADDFAR